MEVSYYEGFGDFEVIAYVCMDRRDAIRNYFYFPPAQTLNTDDKMNPEAELEDLEYFDKFLKFPNKYLGYIAPIAPDYTNYYIWMCVGACVKIDYLWVNFPKSTLTKTYLLYMRALWSVRWTTTLREHLLNLYELPIKATYDITSDVVLKIDKSTLDILNKYYQKNLNIITKKLTIKELPFLKILHFGRKELLIPIIKY